ncbi:UNVERIFIED_ORG: hypothetical protein ABIB21_001378 [Arthrobacter sp. UYEF13]
MLQLDVGEPRVLNGTAARIWLLMDGCRGEDDIVALLCDEFGQPVSVIGPQVAAFFEGLLAERLIEATSFETSVASGQETAIE